MSEPKDELFGEFGWGNFERFWGGKFPFAQNGQVNESSIEEFVKGVISQVMPMSNDLAARYYKSDIFETHYNVVVRITFPTKEAARNAKIQATTNQVVLSGLPDNQKQTIKLPHPIVPESCKAEYQDGIVQLSFRKFKVNEPYHDIKVRFPE